MKNSPAVTTTMRVARREATGVEARMEGAPFEAQSPYGAR